MTAAASAPQLKVSHLWQLEKYARLLQEKQCTQPQNGASWKHYCSSDNAIQMSLLENSHLMISSGKQIYESISLWDARKWIQGITKGDSALFIYKMNNENRRFRVKFSPMTAGGSSVEACKHCSSILSSLIPMSEMPAPEGSQARQGVEPSSSQFRSTQFSLSQLTQSDSQQLTGASFIPADGISLPSTGTDPREDASTYPKRDALIPVPEIAKIIQSKGQSLGDTYASTNFPTEQLGPFIRLCFTDANFPAFVEAVERELNTMTRSS